MKKLLPLLCLLAWNCPAQTPMAPAPAPTAGATNHPLHSTTIPSDDNYRSHAAANHQCEAQVAAMRHQEVDVIFIGDSITQNFINAPTERWPMAGKAVWDRYYGTRHVLNFGVGADRTENVLWRFDHMDVQDLRPKVAVIMIGTNNNHDTPAAIAAGVQAVIARTQAYYPGVKIILVSILPSARAAQKMAAANQLIAHLGDDRTVFYFDLAALMPPVGDTWKGLGRDRLHLMPEGYELWASAMDPLLNRLLGSGT